MASYRGWILISINMYQPIVKFSITKDITTVMAICIKQMGVKKVLLSLFLVSNKPTLPRSHISGPPKNSRGRINNMFTI